ncbi:MAG: class I SAM-dependent methyltransferase [Actinobacteria bacterium]|nr:class I SAM-dependent methyltransferase [Actinomycetota bacterium]
MYDYWAVLGLFGNKKVPLPPEKLRMGGVHFRSDSHFIAGAEKDVKSLVEFAGLNKNSRLLDWGCGAGRLAVGIRYKFGRIADYHGVDVQPRLLNWASKNLTAPGYRFTLIDVTHRYYNPDGATSPSALPTPDSSVDIVYAYSVFSHLDGKDVEVYLRAINSALVPGGRGWFTLFVEDDVPPESENPADYGPIEWKVPLHCVRFQRAHFEQMCSAAGLRVEHFEYGQETDGQSLYVVAK